MKGLLAAAGLVIAATLVPAPILLVPLVLAATADETTTLATACDTDPAPAGTSQPTACRTVDLAPVVDFARAQLGKPYVFGATGPDAYDCSGLIQAAYHTIGVHLPRLAEDQATTGTPIPIDPAHVQPGDLIVTWGGSPPHDHGHIAIAITTTDEIQAPKTGDTVQITPIAYARVQAIRRVARGHTALAGS